MLDVLEKRCRVLEMGEVPDIQRLLDFCGRTLPRYTENGRAIDTLHDAWVRRAEELLVVLCQPGVGSAVTDQHWRLALAADALHAMRGATSRGAQLLAKRIHPRVYERYGQRRCGIAYYAALFRCLREARLRDYPEWLIAKCIWPDAKQGVMSIPALIELAQIGERDEARLRRLAVKLLYKVRPLEQIRHYPGRERGLQFDVLLTVVALAGASDAVNFAHAGPSLAALRKLLSRPTR